MTVEDPVEYNFPGICQVQINEEIGEPSGSPADVCAPGSRHHHGR